MKQKRLTIVAVTCGAVCALCVFAFMGTVQGEANAARAEALARYGGEQVDICVAARDIAAGERVDASAVETKLWVADLLPAGAVSDRADVVGKTAASSILKGEVFSAQRFDRARDALEVPEGMVALSVPAKAVQAVGGAVRPGMHVDIYATGDSAAAAVAQEVPVLATSSDEGGSLASDASWITIALKPEQVQEMVTASTRYDLYFALPGTGDVAAASEAESGAAEEAKADADANAKPLASGASAVGQAARDSSDALVEDDSYAESDQAADAGASDAEDSDSQSSGSEDGQEAVDE